MLHPVIGLVEDVVDFSCKDAKSSAMEVPASMAQLYAPSDWRPGGRGFNPRQDRQHSFSLPSVDSRRTVVSFWRKNVHNTGTV